MTRLIISVMFAVLVTLANAQNLPLREVPAPVGNAAGSIVLSEGTVEIYSPDKRLKPANAGDKVLEGDSIVTGNDGEIHLSMEDGGYISVRPNTKMRIAKYQANGESTDTGVFGLLQGSFRSISGWIGKFNRERYIVRTPTATIGIRGTDHEPMVILKGASEGEPGTYDKVNAGSSYIKSETGRIDIAQNQAGFASPDRRARPRLLAAVPAFFRVWRTEGILAGKHNEIQALIVERREARRHYLKQKIGERRRQKFSGAEKGEGQADHPQHRRRPEIEPRIREKILERKAAHPRPTRESVEKLEKME